MIISNIIGGLGNQMFQYAAGRACSLRLGVPLKLDTRDFSGYQLHQGFELNRLFNCYAEIATDIDLAKTLGWQRLKLAQRLLRKPQLKNLRYKSFVVEPHFNYWSDINKLGDVKYLYGYWQSEKYFTGFTEKIRDDFSFKLPLLGGNAEIARVIEQVNSVSLHVRRGDYITNAKNKYIGVCSLDYYKMAIDHINSTVDQPVFFIFSDDINWVESNLTINAQAVFVNYNYGAESYNDMRLMSLCKYNIIANSSFSWWGAWLNPNPEKVVIAPKDWFANKQDDSDLIPFTWLKL